MSWSKREAVTNLVILGDGDGNKKKIGGLLAAISPDRGYPDKMNYEIVQQDGETALLSGSASLARQIGPADIGKFIKCEFTGWGKSANGKFKMIDVNVWEGEPSDAMKAWPRFAEFQQAGKRPAAKASEPPPPNDDDFAALPDEDDDDLPF